MGFIIIRNAPRRLVALETLRSALLTATGLWACMVLAKATRDAG